MTVIDSIWARARDDLVIVGGKGQEDVFLWEHSARIARCAQLIARLPGVQALAPDIHAVVAASLYHNAGWAVVVREGEIDRCAVLMRPTSVTQREHAIQMMENSLAALLPPGVVERSVAAVRSMGERDIDSIEGQIVAEAENLNEFGLLTLWANIRRGAIEGKGVQAAVDTWHRRREYQYWTALLNDSFRFDEVRAIARQRLQRYEQVMAAIEEQHECKDVTAALGAEEPAAHVQRDGR
jgi:hypothetical protein